MRRVLLTIATLVLASLAIAGPASAKGVSGGGGGGGGGGTSGGGGGGGGTTTTVTNGAILNAGGTAVCDSGTVISVSLRKGFNKSVEAQIIPLTEGTNPDGTPAGQGWWTQSLFNNTTGTSVGGWGGNQTMAPGLIETILLGAVPVGTSELTYTATRKQLTGPNVIDLAALATQPVVESCSVNITVTAK